MPLMLWMCALVWVDQEPARFLGLNPQRELHPPGEAERGALLESWVGALLRAYGVSCVAGAAV